MSPNTERDAHPTQAVIERIEDGVAVVVVGDDGEEWDFPASLLPPEAGEGTVLVLEPVDRGLEVVGLGHGPGGIDERLSRGLNRKRPIVLPLPRRARPPETEVEALGRPSRHSRALGH